MDPFAGIFPPRRAHSIYRCLELIGALGLAEALLGAICVCTEVTGLVLYILTEHGYALEIWGICTGVFVIIVGIWNYLTKLALIKARARHCMFLLGLCMTALCGGGCFMMLRWSIEKTRNLYGMLKTVKVETDFSSENSQLNTTNFPESTDARELATMAPLRAADAVIYMIMLGALLASFLLNCKNIRRIMKNGQPFIPRYKYLRIPGTRRQWEQQEHQDCLSKDTNPKETVVIDKHGSLWILPGAEEAIATKSAKK